MKSRAKRSARRFRFRTAICGSCSTARAWPCANVLRLTGLRIRRCNINRLKPRVHYLMCSFCARYAKQLNYMREVAREFPEKIGEISDATLPAEAKERLKEALRQ